MGTLYVSSRWRTTTISATRPAPPRRTARCRARLLRPAAAPDSFRHRECRPAHPRSLVTLAATPRPRRRRRIVFELPARARPARCLLAGRARRWPLRPRRPARYRRIAADSRCGRREPGRATADSWNFRAASSSQRATTHRFSLHGSTTVAHSDRLALERLLRYFTRLHLAQARLFLLRDGRVAYELRKPWSRHQTHRVMTPLELIARRDGCCPLRGRAARLLDRGPLPPDSIQIFDAHRESFELNDYDIILIERTAFSTRNLRDG